MARKISTYERRRMDQLRRTSLKAGSVYERKLIRLRRKEVGRVLRIASDASDADGVIAAFSQLNENAYLPDWWKGIFSASGLPMARATAKDLRSEKASLETDMWLRMLVDYATERAGEEIVSVTGTLRETLIAIVRKLMERSPEQGIEKLTRSIYSEYQTGYELWQCRRIAQTESMIAAARASADAATTLDIPFTKQWCISGLGNTRETHELMDGVEVDENEPFSLPGGLMLYPHDTTFGADAAEIINCACSCIRRPK